MTLMIESSSIIKHAEIFLLIRLKRRQKKSLGRRGFGRRQNGDAFRRRRVAAADAEKHGDTATRRREN